MSDTVTILEVVGEAVRERLAQQDADQRAAVESVREELRQCRQQIEAIPPPVPMAAPVSGPTIHVDTTPLVAAIERAATAAPAPQTGEELRAVARAVEGMAAIITAQNAALERLCETIEELVDRPLPPLRKFRIRHGFEESTIIEEE